MTIQVKHSKVSTIPDTDDTSLVRPSDWNADHTLTGTIDITNGGTGASTATGAINNLLPTQTGQSGKYLGTDGTNPQWLTVPSAGGGSSVSYYLNGGTNQGTFGGNTYYQMSKTAVIGTSANFTIAANGYITQFLTDANDPALLNIPAGNWNFEMFFAASSAGGTPSFYVELYKYNGTTFTLIASGSTSPESITGGTVKDVYTTALAVPATSLSLTDRLAVRVYVNNSGRTITLYTQDANLCQVITTFSTGITALNGLTAQVQTFATGTTGTDFNINSATSTHTFNIPSSSASNRGLLTSADWTTFNNKANAFTYTTNYIPYGQGTTTPAQSANLTFNGTTLTANDITDSSLTSGRVTYAGTGGNLRDASNFTYDGTNLVAGAIQNTPIGSTTASTGSFTTLNSTGGALNGTIGATTPATGTFTTITGQTEVLRGTGQNLLTQSNTFTNAAWATSSATVATTVATTDPFGGNNAFSITASATGTSGIGQAISGGSNGVYTFSVYAKAGTSTWLRLFVSTSIFAYFNLSTGVVGTVNAGGTATITSIGNGWYRCSITSVSTSSVGIRLADGDNNASATSGTFLYVFGSQAELSSTVGTYIPTTTTAVYGTPTLSFSGVSTIGLQSNGALYLQPAGTGAIQAQATTSTSAGGNARGANAVDWQTERATAAQIASGQNSFVGSGYGNYSNNYCGVTVGGYANGSSYLNSVGGGQGNFSTAQWAAISGGNANTGSGFGAFIGGGSTNTAAGYFNVIGGGFTNSGTANAAVTTQSGTMNGTTAVTLSGSNASIKVGQYISGTSIANDTYVAAISGTSLTLSKNASGSSTSTLSFFTPHGVVVGGGNNQATGAYSFIGGGGDAGTSANRNVASGDWSFVGGGLKTTASSTYSGVVGGTNNTASGFGSFIGCGAFNTASATYTAILGGNANTANASGASVLSGYSGATRSIVGNTIFTASVNPINTSSGTSQSALLVLGRQTTDATPTVLCSDANAAGTTNQVILPNNSAYYFTGEVVSGVTGGGNSKGWEISGLIKRGANAAATTLVGSTVTSLYADAGAATWTIALAADTTNGGLRVTFTGQAATTIRTVCQIRTTEMTF